MIVTPHHLGRVEYADGLELQRQFQEARRANTVHDTLLLLEHPPVLTLGRGAKETNIITPRPVLESMGVTVFETDRGGDVTYHGPGQLVGYPLIHLEPGKQDVRKYVRNIEEVIIRTLADFELAATRMPQWPGVWVEHSRLGGPRKICALGVHLSRWYTRHGFALNVQPNLSHFELIVPCGIREAGVTSMALERQREFALPEIEARIAHHFAVVFEATLEPAPSPTRTIAVAVVRDDGRVLLLKRTEARGGFWQIVTGRVEVGESAHEAALRELREETGLSLEPTSAGYVHSFAHGGAKVTEETGFFVRPEWVDQIWEPGSRGSSVRPEPVEGASPSQPGVVHGHASTGSARTGGPLESHQRVVLSDEHSAMEWVTPQEALTRLPFEGLREIVRRAERAHSSS